MLSITSSDASISAAAPVAVDDDVFARVEARLAEMADPAPEDWSHREHVVVATRNWSVWDDAEAKFPTIDHKPTITLWDDNGGMRVITAPLPVSERWQPPAGLSEKKLQKWQKFFADRAAAIAAKSTSSMMQFANRIIAADDKDAKARAGKGKKKIAGTIPDHIKANIDRPVRNRQRVEERLQGFVAPKAHIRADRRYLPFNETFDGEGLRSRLGIRGFELYNSRIPRNALYGYSKETVFNGWEIEPIFLRDASYLTIDCRRVRGQLAIDLDENFDTLEDLRRVLIEALGHRLFPTFVVYRLNKLGQIERPHLIWILPPGSEVGVYKSRQAPVRLFNAVQRALVSHLIDLGADARHHNTGKTKCPLDPHFSVACRENFPDLTDFVAGLPTISTNEKEMKRRQAKFQRVDIDDVSTSADPEFDAILKIIKTEISAGFRSRNRQFKDSLASPAAYERWLSTKVTPIVLDWCDTPSVRSKLKKQIEWRRNNVPSTNSRPYDGDNRYRDRSLYKERGLTGAKSPEARKKQGKTRQEFAAEQTNLNQHKRTLAKVVEQVENHLAAGLPDDRSEIVRSVIQSKTVGRSTAYDYIDEAIAVVHGASRYIASLIPSDIQEPATVVEPVVVHANPSPDPVVSIEKPEPQAASGVRSTAKSTSPRRNPGPARGRLRDLDDDPILVAVEIVRRCVADGGKHGSPVIIADPDSRMNRPDHPTIQ